MVAKATAPRRENVPRHILFYRIGNFVSIRYAPRGCALWRSGIMSLARPAAGGESCEAGFFLRQLGSFIPDC